ncbi:MAG: putative DNA modification/repair radical SAM protein [Kiritimatiellia bacterium]
MNTSEKLEILTSAAKYDASCASSGSRRKGTATGNTSVSGICHSWSADGRCISLLKILLSNVCLYDCAYCANRRSTDIPRATFAVDEVVRLTMDFYRRNYIEGLFLSSAVFASPCRVMEQMVGIARKLRTEEGFGGYIHLKAIPGADQALLDAAGRYADRVSVNIELPSEAALNRLAPDKHKQSILKPMRYLAGAITENRAERRKHRNLPAFAPGGQSTQLIVGASPESDLQIIKLGESLYRNYQLNRVYYSAYIPVNRADSRLEQPEKPPLLREHRLYQADWLLRNYGFRADELLGADQPQLDPVLDPKAMWALRNYHVFPIDVNRADYRWILRIPGVGVTSAKRIVAARKFRALTERDLRRCGVAMNRAQYFIRCQGGPTLGTRTYPVAAVHQALMQKVPNIAQLEFAW